MDSVDDQTTVESQPVVPNEQHDVLGQLEVNDQAINSPHHQDDQISAHSPTDHQSRRLSSGVSSNEKRFMRSTLNRGNYEAAWIRYLKEKEEASSPSKVKKVADLNLLPGEGLLKMTQSRIHERKQWEEYVKKIKPYEDDIWWEKRRPSGSVSPVHKSQVKSRLTEPTVATVVSKHDKHPSARSDSGSPARLHSPARQHSAHVVKVDENSHLLKSTNSSRHQQVVKEGNLLHSPPPDHVVTVHLEGKSATPHVFTSKLFQPTESFQHSTWAAVHPPRPLSPPRSIVENDTNSPKGKTGRTQSLSPRRLSSPSTPPSDVNKANSCSKVSTPTSRLLVFNTAMLGKQREKLVKPQPDPRELGWNQFHHKL
jgi:hypothetical protein